MNKQENANPESVAAENSGNDTEVNETKETVYTAKQVESIVLDRLKRAEKAFEKKLEATKKDAPKQQVNQSLEEEWKSKIADYETQIKSKEEAISKYKTTTLNKTMVAALADAECVDADLVARDLISSGRVVIDEETGEVVAESVTGQVTVNDLVAEYAKKKPFLFRSNAKGGTGSKSPNTAIPGNTKEERKKELEQKLGINREKVTNIFSR